LRDLYVRENFVFDSLIYFEHVERYENRSNVMKFRSFGDSTSSRRIYVKNIYARYRIRVKNYDK